MSHSLYEQFQAARHEAEQNEFRTWITQGGYSLFVKFIDGFRDAIRNYDEPDGQHMLELVERAQQLFPNPSRFSPHWQLVWEEFHHTVSFKNSVFARIPAEQRAGEWQIILDNPFTNQEVVCYPALHFIEAAYLYGYFRPELKENEYVRLQKVQECIVEFGYMNDKNSASS